MKEKLLKNWGLKIMAVLISFLVWFLVANIEDYSISKTITGIPVAILNEEAITEHDMVYEVEQGKTVDIKVEGRRSIVEGLTAEDFSASADLSELSITNSVQITVDAINSLVRREVDISIVDSTMKVAIEERGEQKLPISVMTLGETQEGYAVVNATATPNMVTITGAASKVKDIKTVRVEVDVEGLNTSISARGDLILLDADGAVIEADKLTMSLSSVNVKVSIQKTKEVPIQVTPLGEVAEGYSIAGEIEYQPTTVLIAGDEEDLRNVRAITVGDIDVTDRSSDYEVTVDINNYLPEGVVVADQTQEIAVQIKIERLIEKTITIKSSDITFAGCAEDLDCELSEDEGPYEVTLIGLKETLDAVTVADLKPTVDVTEYLQEGTYSCTLTMEDLEGVQYEKELSVMVIIAKREPLAASTEENIGTTENPAGKKTESQ